jgi:hypothetical protein
MKIRFLKSLNHSKFISLYKISNKGELILNPENLILKHYKRETVIPNVETVRLISPGGLNFESWVEISYSDNGVDKKTIYVTGRCLFGVSAMEILAALRLYENKKDKTINSP